MNLKHSLVQLANVPTFHLVARATIMMTPLLGHKPIVRVILLISFIPSLETASYLFYGVDSGSMGLNNKYVRR